MTQRRASSRLDLPQPFGPTPVRPVSMTSSVGSTNDLNPTSLSLVMCTRASPSWRASADAIAGVGVEPNSTLGLAGGARCDPGRDQRIDDLADLLDAYHGF